SIVQLGTVFNSSAPNDSNQLNYWIATIMISGQGHAAMIFSSAGTNARINSATSGRLSGNTLGTMQNVTTITSSSTSYNPGDAGITRPRRWGDYSFVSVDPNDDMTMWGVMGFCDNTNSYGVRVTKLIAPPPPPLTSASPNNLNPGQPSVNVIVTGTPVNGEGFFDPGSGFTNRIAASMNGGVTVNSITYNSPTQVTLDLNTVGSSPGEKNIIITNPDGQAVSSSVIFEIVAPVYLSSFDYSIDKRDVTLKWVTEMELNNRGFDIERMRTGGEWKKIGYIDGQGTTNQPHEYIFKDLKLETGKYNYRLKQIDYNGSFERFFLNNYVSVGIPGTADLFQNYPNPFNPITKIDFNLPVDGMVSLKVYDIIGREAASIVNEFKNAGYYTVEFDASKFASGVYFYLIAIHSDKLVSGNFTMVKKMLVVK
ncbi:MAG TPA: T9SS type A sorting domain-containing protein, partial [Ignavibacteria bacterium]|nr:T9SS type A sorting domain-containing protein [Ignavibacteria bacterium]